MDRSARTVADSMKPGDRSYNLVVRMSLFSNNRYTFKQGHHPLQCQGIMFSILVELSGTGTILKV
jgi:hypothetical protein